MHTKPARHPLVAPTSPALHAVPQSDQARVLALHELSLLDTPPEEHFDHITRLPCCLPGVPISLIGRVVDDARLAPRFANNPFVTGAPDVRLYAGIPLAAPDGSPAGRCAGRLAQPRRAGHAFVASPHRPSLDTAVCLDSPM